MVMELERHRCNRMALELVLELGMVMEQRQRMALGLVMELELGMVAQL